MEWKEDSELRVIRKGTPFAKEVMYILFPDMKVDLKETMKRVSRSVHWRVLNMRRSQVRDTV